MNSRTNDYVLAGAVVAGWTVLATATRSLLTSRGYDAALFALSVQVIAGIGLLVGAGLDRLPTRPLRRWSTWVIGLSRVVTVTCYTTALALITATEASLLATVNVLAGALGVRLAFARRPRPAELIGLGLIAAGILGVILGTPGGFGEPAVLLILASETSVVVALVLSERHPENILDARSRLALAGFVTLIAALGVAVAWVVLGSVPGAGAIVPSIAPWGETASDPVFWIAVAAIALLLRGPLTYGAFAVTRRLGADGYLLSLALLPSLTYGAETLAHALGVLPPPRALGELAAGGLILLGCVWNVAIRLGARRSA